MYWRQKGKVEASHLTGIIPFSGLGVFYANLGSAEIFFCQPKKGSSKQMANKYT